MNQSASKAYRCEFHRAEIVSAVLLLVCVFLIKHDGLLDYAGFPALSWIWILCLPASMIPAWRWHGRWRACAQDDPVGESDLTYE